MSPDFTFVDYDSGRDGQLLTATGTYYLTKDGTSWFDATGISKIVIQGAFAGGTTTVFVEQNREGGTGAALVTSTDQKATIITDNGATINIAYQFVRIRVVQATANSTNAQVAAKGIA